MLRHTTLIEIVTFLLFIVALTGCSQFIYQHENNKRKDLSKNWNVTYCSYNDCSHFFCDTIDLPSSFTPSLLIHNNDFRGFIILTKEFTLTNIDSDFYLLSLGKIGDADVTYCNGIKNGV